MASETAVPALSTQPPAIPRSTKPGRSTPIPAYTTPPTSRSTSPSNMISPWPQTDSIMPSRPFDPNGHAPYGGNGHLHPSAASSDLDMMLGLHGGSHTNSPLSFSQQQQQQQQQYQQQQQQQQQQHYQIQHHDQSMTACPDLLSSPPHPSQPSHSRSLSPSLAAEVSSLLRSDTLNNRLSSSGPYSQNATKTKHTPAPLQLDQANARGQSHLLPPLSPPRQSLVSPTSPLFARSRSPSPAPFSPARLSQSLSDGRLESSYHQIVDDQKYFTAFAQSTLQTEPILAIASAAKMNNKIYFYDYTSPRLATGSRVEPLTLKATLPHASPIYSLAWSSNHLLTGGANGTVQLFQVDYAALSSSDPSQSLLLNNSFQTLQVNKLSESPGSYIATTRVNRVQFASDPSLFLTTTGHTVDIWNVHRPQVPVHKCSISSQAVHAAQLSPHADSFLYAFGGMDRHLRIMDRRQNFGDREAMLLAEAHRGSIRDVQWNPYVPYWLASCGDDGQIKVWDLRFQSRAMVELGEYGQGFYQSIAWSNTHCDIISSSSRDRAFQVWKLGVQWALDEAEPDRSTRRRSSRTRPLSGGHIASISSSSALSAATTLELAKLGTLRRSPLDMSSLSIGSHPAGNFSSRQSTSPNSKGSFASHHKVVTGSQAAMVRDMSDASIVQILSSNQEPGTFMTLTSAGILATHCLRPSTLDTLALHRDSSNCFSREYEVERSLYRRDLTDVCQQLLDWMRSGEDDEEKRAKKGGSNTKETKNDQSHSRLNPREMLDRMASLPSKSLSSQSWTLPGSSSPSTPASPGHPADQLQVPNLMEGGAFSTRRRRFSAQIFSTDRSRSRSPSANSSNNDAALLTGKKPEPAHLSAFIEDFERYTLEQLPPGFPLRLANQPVPADLKLRIANVVKREELMKLAQSQQAQTLVDRLDDISSMARRDPLNMDAASLCEILSCVMDWDHVQGLRMARVLIRTLSSPATDDSTCSNATVEDGENARWWSLVHMALFPTVFDRSIVHCGPEAYDAYRAVRASGRRQMLERFHLTFNESKRRSFTSLKTPVLQDFETAQAHLTRSASVSEILEMLDFEIHVQSILAQESHTIPAHIVLELFHPNEYQGSKTTISQQTMAIYFDATAMTGQWGDYFETLDRILRNFSYVVLNRQGQPNIWLASSIKKLEEALLVQASSPTLRNQSSPPAVTMMASPMSMSNKSSETPVSSSENGVLQPSRPLPTPPALISHFLWTHFDRFGLPTFYEQLTRLLEQPPQALMQIHPIVLESWVMALGRVIKVWWGGDKLVSTSDMTLMAATLGGVSMANVVLARRQLEFQFDAVASRFFQRIAVGPTNSEQTRENAERQANALMDQLRSNGLLKRKNQSENPVPEADRLYQALLEFLRAGSIEQQTLV